MNFTVKDVAVSDLRPYADHARVISDEAVKAVMDSVREFGWRVPLVVSEGLEIITGHVRWMAAQRLGLETIPCHIVHDLNGEQIRALRLVDNRTAELSEWDEKKLLAELLELDETDMAMEEWFAEEVARALEEDNQNDPDEIPPLPEEPQSQPDTLYSVGRHLLYVGDSTKPASYAALGAERIDLLLTDPPYNVAYEGGTEKKLKIKNDDMGAKEFVAFLDNAFACAANALKPGGSFYVFHADKEAVAFRTGLEKNHLPVRQQLIWLKNHFVLGRQDYQWRHEPCFYGWKKGAAHYFGGGRKQDTILAASLDLLNADDLRSELKRVLNDSPSSVIECDRPTRNDDHPTAKPTDLLRRLIDNSTKPGQTVLDPFGGSGSTLMACELTGRRCVTIELDPCYADVIRRRWAEYTHGIGCDWFMFTPEFNGQTESYSV